MTEKIRVIGAAVVLPLVSGSERYLYRGAEAEAKGFTPEGVEHAVKVGLVQKFDGADDETAEPPAPEGPSEKWTNDRLIAYAGEKSIDLGEATTKKEMLAVIAAAQPAPAGS